MIGRCAAVLLLLMAVMSPAQAAADGGYLVALVDLDCHACRVLNESASPLAQMAASKGLTWSFAPVPQSGDASDAWKERVFYVARDKLGSTWGDQTLTALFAAQDNRDFSLDSEGRVAAWLGLQIPGVRWRQLFSNEIQKGGGIKQVNKALLLMRHIKAVSFPAFALISGGKVTAIPATGDLKAKMSDLKTWLNNYSVEKK